MEENLDRIKYLVVISDLLNAINNNRENDIINNAEEIVNIVNYGRGQVVDDERETTQELAEEIDVFLDDEDLRIKEEEI
jgi:hypothetical protein